MAAKNKNPLVDKVPDDVQEPVADNGTAFLKGALQNYYCIFHRPSHKLLDHLAEGGCGVEVKIDHILTDFLYYLRCELERQIFDYDSFSEYYIAEMERMCGDYLEIEGHVHLLYSAVQL